MLGYGHTEPADPSTRAQDHIAGYLIDLELPAKGTRCEQDVKPFT